MTSTNHFQRIAAICAFATAITTFLLWLLPRLYVPPVGFEESITLYQNPHYMARMWVNFLHLPIALMGYFGLFIVLYKREAAKAGFGMLWFLVWGIVEMVGIAVNLFSVNYTWRPAYGNADSATKIALQNNIEAFASVWSSAFFVLLIAFLLGSLFFAWATWPGRGLEKLLSWLLWLAVPLTLLIILSNYADQQWAGQITTFVYPALQPVSRFVLGLFLWRKADKQLSQTEA
jgi:hypothetical protein